MSVGIEDNDGIKKGEFLLNHLDLKNKGGGGLFKNSTLTYDIYRTDSVHIGKLKINLIDKVNKTIQGTFYFKAYNAYRNDSVNITDGKFRLKYKM